VVLCCTGLDWGAAVHRVNSLREGGSSLAAQSNFPHKTNAIFLGAHQAGARLPLWPVRA